MDMIDWLLDGDPAIRWQVLRDLTDADRNVVAVERARVAREGLGARLLARQGDDGAWHQQDQPDWVPTLCTMRALRVLAIDPADPAVASAVERLAAGFRWHDSLGGKPFFAGETEPCINGGALACSGYFGRPDHELAKRLVAEQLPDGGWNCDAPKSKVSSYHSTISVLEGLLDHERATGASEISEIRRRGEAYLLDRGLFRRRSTGDVADPAFLMLRVPTRYHYDVLRGLDYFRDAGVAPDARMADAVAAVAARRQPDGAWLLDASSEDADVLGETVRQPSRWNTLRALRVLRWFGA
jgi:hypothetical protein